MSAAPPDRAVDAGRAAHVTARGVREDQSAPRVAALDRLTIATRNSPLALWQAEHVKSLLETRFPNLSVELLRMTTRGDVLLDSPLSKIGGKGLFVKELETAMLDGRADIAVHSIKDVPATLPDGLEVAVMMARENPRDAFVSNRYDSPADLLQGARIGTCSLRRQAQLLARRPDLDVQPLRGNVNTRLRKLDDGEYDAIVLAAAGLIRLGMQDRIRAEFPIEDSLPAAGQGIVGIESRIGDTRVSRYLAALHDPSAAARCRAERGLSARLDGGCQVPIGAYSIVRRGQVWLRGLVATPDGATVLRAQASAAPAHAHRLGVRVAEDLLAQGADRVLADLGLSPAPLDAMSTVFAEAGESDSRSGMREGREAVARGGEVAESA